MILFDLSFLSFFNDEKHLIQDFLSRIGVDGYVQQHIGYVSQDKRFLSFENSRLRLNKSDCNPMVKLISSKKLDLQNFFHFTQGQHNFSLYQLEITANLDFYQGINSVLVWSMDFLSWLKSIGKPILSNSTIKHRIDFDDAQPKDLHKTEGDEFVVRFGKCVDHSLLKFFLFDKSFCGSDDRNLHLSVVKNLFLQHDIASKYYRFIVKNCSLSVVFDKKVLQDCGFDFRLLIFLLIKTYECTFFDGHGMRFDFRFESRDCLNLNFDCRWHHVQQNLPVDMFFSKEQLRDKCQIDHFGFDLRTHNNNLKKIRFPSIKLGSLLKQSRDSADVTDFLLQEINRCWNSLENFYFQSDDTEIFPVDFRSEFFFKTKKKSKSSIVDKVISDCRLFLPVTICNSLSQSKKYLRNYFSFSTNKFDLDIKQTSGKLYYLLNEKSVSIASTGLFAMNRAATAESKKNALLDFFFEFLFFASTSSRFDKFQRSFWFSHKQAKQQWMVVGFTEKNAFFAKLCYSACFVYVDFSSDLWSNFFALNYRFLNADISVININFIVKDLAICMQQMIFWNLQNKFIKLVDFYCGTATFAIRNVDVDFFIKEFAVREI